jgi:hypothetical protein
MVPTYVKASYDGTAIGKIPSVVARDLARFRLDSSYSIGVNFCTRPFPLSAT